MKKIILLPLHNFNVGFTTLAIYKMCFIIYFSRVFMIVLNIHINIFTWIENWSQSFSEESNSVWTDFAN